MSINNKNVLGDDLPKVNPWQQDRLGYAPFAKRLAKVILDLHVPNGFVIGLHGQWGSGKSTALNFIAAFLTKHNQEAKEDISKIEQIDFRPWIVAGHQDLVAAFFKVLSENLGPNRGWWSRRWRQFVRLFKGTSNSLIDSVAIMAVTIDPTAGIASRATGEVVKKSLSGMIDRFLETPSLQSAHEDLKKQLVGSGRRFIVTIDDLDRLEDSEVRSIMQMVKTVGRLPNVIYLLAYDRRIVWRALDGAVEIVGPRFAEKIVQQEVELPKPSRGSLLIMLDEEISFLTEKTEESSRWTYLVRDGVHRWIRSPRDVLRLSNAVKFSAPALSGELDPQDLLAMEGLRLFDEGVYNWIRDNRDFLFGEGHFVLASDEVKKAAVEILGRRIQEENKQQIFRILAVLFPQSGKWFEERHFSDESYVEVVQRRGIGSEAGYDAYFGFHPSVETVRKSVVDNVIDNLDNSQILEGVFRSYFDKRNSQGEPLVGKLMEELLARYRTRSPARPTQALLDALFRIGEEVFSIESSNRMLSLDPRAQMSFLIRAMLQSWGPEAAGQHLLAAFEQSPSAAFCADVYVDRGRELGVFKSTSSESACISHEDFGRLGTLLLTKILAASKDESLTKAPFYFDIARAWAHLGQPEDVKLWLAKGITSSGTFMAKIGRGLLTHSIGTKDRTYTMREPPDSSLYDLRQLIDAGKKHLAGHDLSDDERKIIDEVVRGSERTLTVGTPESSW